MKRVRGDDVLPWLTFVEPTLPEFDELERDVWDYLEVPSKRERMTCWMGENNLRAFG